VPDPGTAAMDSDDGPSEPAPSSSGSDAHITGAVLRIEDPAPDVSSPDLPIVDAEPGELTDGDPSDSASDEDELSMEPMPPPDTQGNMQIPLDLEAPNPKDLANRFKPMIRIFNDMLLVVHDTMASAIGADQAKALFDAGLANASELHPGLFDGLRMNDAGQLSYKRLSEALARLAPPEPSELLRRAMYDLVKAQLYDAKHALPPMDEARMMQALDNIEQELHGLPS
jgi:hypothetical protein